jgi:hypothetical protein
MDVARSLKEEANALYKQGRFAEAADKYSAAVRDLDHLDARLPLRSASTDELLSRLLSNLSVSRLKMLAPQTGPGAAEQSVMVTAADALSDAQRCFYLDPAWKKAGTRIHEAREAVFRLFKDASLTSGQAQVPAPPGSDNHALAQQQDASSKGSPTPASPGPNDDQVLSMPSSSTSSSSSSFLLSVCPQTNPSRWDSTSCPWP